MTQCSKDPHSLNLFQLWVFVLTTINLKKKFLVMVEQCTDLWEKQCMIRSCFTAMFN